MSRILYVKCEYALFIVSLIDHIASRFRRFGKSGYKPGLDQLNHALSHLSLAQSLSQARDAPIYPPSHIVSLPTKIHECIFRHTSCREGVLLAGTCTTLRPLAPLAYSHLSFSLAGPGGEEHICRTLLRMRQLLDVLHSPEYAMKIYSICIDALPGYARTVPSCAWGVLISGWDDHLSRLLQLARALQHFSWVLLDYPADVVQTRAVAQLVRLPSLRRVTLRGLHLRSMDESPYMKHKSNLSIEEFYLEIENLPSQWCDLVLRDNMALRKLWINELSPGDRRGWIDYLIPLCYSWTNLQTIVLSCSGYTLHCILTFIRHCAVSS